MLKIHLKQANEWYFENNDFLSCLWYKLKKVLHFECLYDNVPAKKIKLYNGSCVILFIDLY